MGLCGSSGMTKVTMGIMHPGSDVMPVGMVKRKMRRRKHLPFLFHMGHKTQQIDEKILTVVTQVLPSEFSLQE